MAMSFDAAFIGAGAGAPAFRHPRGFAGQVYSGTSS